MVPFHRQQPPEIILSTSSFTVPEKLSDNLIAGTRQSYTNMILAVHRWLAVAYFSQIQATCKFQHS
jgi:hypothetical protein